MTEALIFIAIFAALMVAVFMYRDLQYSLKQLCDDMEALCIAVRALHEEKAKQAAEAIREAPEEDAEKALEAKKAEEAFVAGVLNILNYDIGK